MLPFEPSNKGDKEINYLYKVLELGKYTSSVCRKMVYNLEQEVIFHPLNSINGMFVIFVQLKNKKLMNFRINNIARVNPTKLIFHNYNK